LSLEAISFLCEGLDYLRISGDYDDMEVVKRKGEIDEKIYERILELYSSSDKENNLSIYSENFVYTHPYNISRVLNYFYNLNYETSKFKKF